MSRDNLSHSFVCPICGASVYISYSQKDYACSRDECPLYYGAKAHIKRIWSVWFDCLGDEPLQENPVNKGGQNERPLMPKPNFVPPSQER